MMSIGKAKLEELTADDFRAHLESDYLVSTPDIDEPLTVRLIDVSNLHENEAGPRSEPFSLIFCGPREVYLPQQIYTLNHDAMGAMDIFLVPIRPDEQGARLQAIFN